MRELLEELDVVFIEVHRHFGDVVPGTRPFWLRVFPLTSAV
jgi:hypothetical protein